MKPQSYLRWEEEAEEGRSLKDRTSAQDKLPKQPKTKKNQKTKQKEIKKKTRHHSGHKNVHMDLRWQEIMHGKRLGRPSIPETSGCSGVPPTLLGNCGAGEVTGMVGGPTPVTVIM